MLGGPSLDLGVLLLRNLVQFMGQKLGALHVLVLGWGVLYSKALAKLGGGVVKF